MNRRHFLTVLASILSLSFLPRLGLSSGIQALIPLELNYHTGRPTVNGRMYPSHVILPQISHMVLQGQLLVQTGPPKGTRWGDGTEELKDPEVVGFVQSYRMDEDEAGGAKVVFQVQPANAAAARWLGQPDIYVSTSGFGSGDLSDFVLKGLFVVEGEENLPSYMRGQ